MTLNPALVFRGEVQGEGSTPFIRVFPLTPEGRGEQRGDPAVHAFLMPLGSSGDVHPFVGLALALRRRGHTPVIATNGHFESLIRGVGIDFLPIGTEDEYHKLTADKDLWSPSRHPQSARLR